MLNQLERSVQVDEGSSSSSSSRHDWNYDVCLIFNSGDSCSVFARDLYGALWKRGIRTFLADESFIPDFARAIRQSKNAIVIFSENFVSSPICLQRLVQVLDCLTGNGRFIWPMFYRVDPSHVRHQTNSYKVAFDNYEKFFSEEFVKSWRSALSHVADLSGWPLEPRYKSRDVEIIAVIMTLNLEHLVLARVATSLPSSFKHLHSLILDDSCVFKEVPDLSGAPGLAILSVAHCKNLMKIYTTAGHHANLRSLRAPACTKLISFLEDGINFPSLETLDLTGCSSLQKFPKILGKMENIKKLALSGTAIETLPESIENLTGLECLFLYKCRRLIHIQVSGHCRNLRELRARGCTKLISFQEDGINFPSLEILDLSGCSNFEKFPEILGKMENIKKLALSGTAIETLPESIENLTGLECLFLYNCQRLCQIPVDSIRKLTKLVRLEAGSCGIFSWFIDPEVEGTVSLAFWNINRLHLNENNISDQLLEVILRCFPRLEVLELRDNDFKVLPARIEECRSLKRLYLDRCKHLQEIRGIPPNTKVLSAVNCTSLTYVSSGCLLSQAPGNRKFILPGRQVPEWIHCFDSGGSVSLRVRNRFPEIAVCVVFDVVGRGSSCFEFGIRVLVNGTRSFDLKNGVLDIECGHIYLFDDLRHEGQKLQLTREHLGKKFNDVRISCSAQPRHESSDAHSYVKYIGVYVYNYGSCADDIQFENPRRTLEDVICDEDYNFSVYSDSSREDRLYYKDLATPENPCGGGNRWHKWLCVIVSSVVLCHCLLHLLWLIHKSLGRFLSFVGYMEQ